jgi:exodeoxyribonuclease VII large subunit
MFNCLQSFYMSDLFFEAEKELILAPNKVVEKESVAGDFLNPNLKSKEVLDQVKWVITQRKSEYLAELLSLKLHKSVAVRRKTAGAVGLLGTLEIIPDIQEWQVSESDRETWLILDDCVDRLQRKSKGEDLSHNINVLTVSEALKRVKMAVSEKVFVIEGELSDVKLNYNMYYFALKDVEDTKIDAYCFSGKVAHFGFPLNEGWSVRATGKFKIDKYSRLRFEIENMQLSGEGEILRNLLLLEEKLDKEGLFDPLRKRTLNILPTKVLLLASSASAALQDFQKVLNARRRGITIYHLPIKTQGVGAEFEILNNLEMANILTEKYGIDTVVITRGGGSKEDLMVFNSEKVVRGIHALNRPSIVAIGHERDHTLAERVADVRASTPSNAAELCSVSELEVLSDLQTVISFCQNFFGTRKQEYLSYTKSMTTIMIGNLLQKINQNKFLVKSVEQLIFGLIRQAGYETKQSISNCQNLVQQNLRESKNLVSNLDRSSFAVKDQVREKNQWITNFWQNEMFEVHQRLENTKISLQSTFSTIQLLDPKKVLSLGYAIISQNGKSLERISQIKKGGKLTVQMQDGVVEVGKLV